MQHRTSLAERTRARALPEDLQPIIVLAGLGLISLQVGFRTWASLHGWFYADDFELLAQATGQPLTPTYLLTPHDSQLMPGGILAAWLVAQAGQFSWTSAALMLGVLQLAASCACLYMLCQLFGRRWAVLLPLSLYLFTTMTLTAFMWWAAAINQVPEHLAFFLATAWHVAYLRTGRLRYAALAAAALMFGLCFYVKALLILVPLAVVTTVWFAEPGTTVGARLTGAVTRYWRAWALYAAVAAGYLAYYLNHVPSPVSTEGDIDYGGLADAMFRVSLGTTLVGGPWEWSWANPPLGQVAAPEWAVTLSWLLIAVWATLRIRAGRGDWRAVLVAIPYLVGGFLLTALGRGAQLGGFAGLELRYLADAAPVLCLSLALFTMGPPPARTASEPSAPTDPAPPRVPVVACVVLAAVVAGAVVSNARYVASWADSPSERFMRTAIASSRESALRLVDEPVPELVMSATSYPSNLPSRMFVPLGDRVQALTEGNDLSMLGSSGAPYPAIVSGGARSRPGPLENCGYPVRGRTRPIAMVGSPEDYFWWAEIGYLANAAGTIELSVGGTAHLLAVEPGAHRFFLQGEGAVTDVSVASASPGTVLCIDHVNIGDVTAVEPL